MQSPPSGTVTFENYPTNLPLQSSSFVGRADEVEAIDALLVEHRLVTLTGVGGVGKTRLALEVGGDALPRFADGVWLVELAPLAQDDMVLATIAEVLGVAAQTGEPLVTTLVSRLKAKQLLVIIDNCEHVIGPVAEFVDRLAASAPAVRVLATSREPLGITAERVRAVPPLAGTSAVELFIERATQAGAVLDDSHRGAIAAICVRLDGIPLAIELAAARARMMTPAQIAERLDQRFRLLTAGGRTAVERHRTLQATVSWSYELLEDAERAVFQRLSTLTGSFDLEAAEAIGAGGTVEGFEVLDALGHLVDKSMVLAVPATTGVRYRLLETLRQFAADRLTEQPDALEVHDRHAAYWRDRAITLGQAIRASDHPPSLFDTIDVDIDHYRSAFAALLSTGRVNDAAAGLLALDLFWGMRRQNESRRWYRQLVEDRDLDGELRLQALAQAARGEAGGGDVYAAERYSTDAIQLAEAAGVDPPWAAPMALTLVAGNRNDPAAFRQWWLQARRIVMATGTRHDQLFIEGIRGRLPSAWDRAELIEHYERLLPEARRLGQPSFEMEFVSVLYDAGQLERARELAQSVIEPARRVGEQLLIAGLFLVAALDALGGDSVRASETAAHGLRITHEQGHTRHVLYFVFITAALAARRDDTETAAVLVTAAARYADPLGLGGAGPHFGCRVAAQTAINAYRGDLTAARRRGETMTIEDLTTYALDSLTAAVTVGDRTPTLRRQRGSWDITYRGEAASVSDSKGIRDLAILLRRPGVDVHVLELAGSPVESGASIEMVDRTALAQYRQRLADLDDDRAEAERNHDMERVARAETEREALLDELRTVSGLGGQSRVSGAHASERARKAVSNRIKNAIRHLEAPMPQLAAHLDQAIVTGIWCRYRADISEHWIIET